MKKKEKTTSLTQTLGSYTSPKNFQCQGPTDLLLTEMNIKVPRGQFKSLGMDRGFYARHEAGYFFD
jgi:hypothetical protein